MSDEIPDLSDPQHPFNADCFTCERRLAEALPSGDLRRYVRRFITCPDCGNKRCPKANRHDNDCTGSNEVGQPGSAWEHA